MSKKESLTWLFIVGVFVFWVLTSGFAPRPSEDQGNCFSQGTAHKLDYSSEKYSYTSPDGTVITGFAIKAGTECYHHEVPNCYRVSGLGSNKVVIERIGDGKNCKQISHVEFIYTEVDPKATPTPTPTDKPTKTPTKTPTNTKTPKPTKTSTPKPSKTPPDKPKKTPTATVTVPFGSTSPTPTATLISCGPMLTPTSEAVLQTSPENGCQQIITCVQCECSPHCPDAYALRVDTTSSPSQEEDNKIFYTLIAILIVGIMNFLLDIVNALRGRFPRNTQ